MIDARFLSMKVQGFRRFDRPRTFSAQDDEGDSLNCLVLAGPNGAGKSSFFEALLYGLGREELIHRELDAEQRSHWLSAALAADGEVQVELLLRTASGTSLAAFTPCRAILIRSRQCWTLELIQDGAATLNAGADSDPIKPTHRHTTRFEDNFILRELAGGLEVEFFSSWRHLILPGPVRPMADLPERARSEQGRLWQLKQWILDERTRSALRGTSGRADRWLERLNDAWHRMRGDRSGSFSLEAVTEDENVSLFDLYLMQDDPDLGLVRVCSVDQLSSGELEWVTLGGTLLLRSFRGILLVDEPELHMHPEFQALLLPALRKVVPEAQIILATHADPPWEQVYSFQRLLLVPEDDPRSGGTA